MEALIERVKALFNRGAFAEGVRLLEGLPKETVEAHEMASLLLAMGRQMLGRLAEAEIAFRKLQKSRDPKIAAFATWGLGNLFVQRGCFRDGLALLESVRDVIRTTGQYPAYLNTLARVYFALGKFDQAEAALREGIEAAKERGDLHLLAALTGNLAVAVDELGHPPEAALLYQDALNLTRRLEMHSTWCLHLHNLAELYAEIDSGEEALRFLKMGEEKGCTTFPEVGLSIRLARAHVYLLLGRLQEAERELQEAQDQLPDAGEMDRLLTHALLTGVLSLKAGKPATALETVSRTLAALPTLESEKRRALEVLHHYLRYRLGRDPGPVTFSLDHPCSSEALIFPLYLRLLEAQGERQRVKDALQNLTACVQKGTVRWGSLSVFWDELWTVWKALGFQGLDLEIGVTLALRSENRRILRDLVHTYPVQHLVPLLRRRPHFPPDLFLLLKKRARTSTDRKLLQALHEDYVQENPLKIHTLGRFEVWFGRFPVPNPLWRRPFTQEVLKFFLVHRNRWLERDFVLEALWPGVSPEKSANRLKVYLSYLREVLEPGLVEAPPQRLIHQEGRYRLNLGPEELDVEAFEHAAREGQRFLENAPDRALVSLERAFSLYRGDFLPEDLYRDDVVLERERLKERYVQVATALADLYTQKGERGRARFVLHTAFFSDPTREDVVRRYLTLLLEQGDRAEAQRIFELHRTALRSRYDLSPNPQLERLLREKAGRKDRNVP